MPQPRRERDVMYCNVLYCTVLYCTVHHCDHIYIIDIIIIIYHLLLFISTVIKYSDLDLLTLLCPAIFESLLVNLHEFESE